MAQGKQLGNVLSTIEFGIGIILTVLIVYLHYVFMSHAGGLWRDEVSTLYVATRPTLSSLYHSLSSESFPALSHIVFRSWVSLFGPDDHVRILGMVVGIFCFGAFWLNMRCFGLTIPYCSLTLFVLNPVTIRYGDSIRAYGVGIFLIVMAFTTLWLFVRRPSLLRGAISTCCLVLTVQCLYQGAFIVFAVCCGGVAVLFRHKQWRTAFQVICMGFVAAISLLVYIPIIREIGAYKALVQTSVTYPALLETLNRAVSSQGVFMPFGWVTIAVAGIVVAVAMQFSQKAPEVERSACLYALVSMLVGSIGFFLYLQTVAVVTQVWHYLPLLALLACCMDIVVGSRIGDESVRLVRIVFFVPFAALTLPASLKAVRVRHTNVDLLVSMVEAKADKEDLIVVMPWYCASTFDRYYKGAAPWTCNPPMLDGSTQRLDWMKTAMMSEAPLNPVLRRIEQTLRSGHRVWWLDNLSVLPAEGRIPNLPAAPNSPYGWYCGVYTEVWSLQTGGFIGLHATSGERIVVPTSQTIDGAENLRLLVVKGWR